MGDRYIQDVECPYCHTLNKDVMFADDWGEQMRCKECKKLSKLVFSFVINAVKILPAKESERGKTP
jgi:Zn ribbon nucleic-acid-binding protein